MLPLGTAVLQPHSTRPILLCMTSWTQRREEGESSNHGAVWKL